MGCMLLNPLVVRSPQQVHRFHFARLLRKARGAAYRQQSGRSMRIQPRVTQKPVTLGSTLLHQPLSRLWLLSCVVGPHGYPRRWRSRVSEQLGADYVLNKSTPEAFCLNIDLTSAEGQELAWKWTRHPSVVLIGMAPPCGTASRAREKPGGPPPLRDGQFPEGFPHSTGKHKLRVDKANIIYTFCT